MIYRRIVLRMRHFHSKLAENIKTFYVQKSFFSPRKSCHFLHNVEKCDTARQTAGENIIGRMHFACWVTKSTNTHAE